MTHPQASYFSQAAIDAFRYTASFKEWNREFENLRRAIRRQVSPRDIQPLLKAGAKEGPLLTKLAFVVYDSDHCLRKLAVCRLWLSSLAAQLVTVSNHATRLVNDPLCDGRFWLAVEGLLSWDLVPKAGVLEGQALKHIRALAHLIQERADALGKLSPQLKKVTRVRGMRDLLAYVWLCTRDSGKNFDAEITYLLSAAYKAAGQEKHFTVDQVKKFRQRHLPKLRNLDKSRATVGLPTIGCTTPCDAQPRLKRKSLGQRIADISLSSK